MQQLTNTFLLAFQLKTIHGLRVIDNGLGPPVYGAEETMVDFAFLAADRKAALPSQFTICMSASTDALLTNLGFFQLLRQSEDPWVTFNLHPEPGRKDHIFKFTVKHTQTRLKIRPKMR